jgi:serine/threonine-protein kinase HipA
MGKQEYHYSTVARHCGIVVPDFKLMNNRYFASRRFDIDKDGNRIHTATSGALLSVSLSTPILDYSNLFALTGFLTHDEGDLEQMFRLMVFNYLTDNKDDHCKNFSFKVINDATGQYTWRLAPAYDLTLCTEGYNGEHATSINGTGHPTLNDIIAVGTKVKMKAQRCREIYDEVRAACQSGGILLHDITQ